MPKATIAILTGGTSSEREIALESAHRIREILAPHYEVRLFDFPRDVNLFLEERKEIQAAIPLFHGRGGEDGTAQGFLQTLLQAHKAGGTTTAGGRDLSVAAAALQADPSLAGLLEGFLSDEEIDKIVRQAGIEAPGPDDSPAAAKKPKRNRRTSGGENEE